MALATKPLVEIVMPSFTMAAASAAVITGFFAIAIAPFLNVYWD